MANRTNAAIKNIIYTNISTIVLMLASFACRMVFVRILNESYLGVNSLFSNVIGLLSVAELGIGSAIGFELYQPLADKEANKDKLIQLMQFYKKCYWAIGTIIFIVGLMLIPFLHYFAKDPGNIGDIRLYYIVFLFNSASSYFVSYKFTLTSADQKNYIYFIVNTLSTLLGDIVQIIALVLTKNYFIYLISGSIMIFIVRIIASNRINNLYPFLKEKTDEKLDRTEISHITRNIKAIFVHKMADKFITQTDNIITSTFVGLSFAGLMDNYVLIISSIKSIAMSISNSVIAGFGNMIATIKDKNVIYERYRQYRFLFMWIMGVFGICIFALINPLVSFLFGEKYLIPLYVLFVYMIEFYFSGESTCLSTIKEPAGIFVQDRWISILRAIVNIVFSIIFAIKFGLVGVYMGTICQRLVLLACLPLIINKNLFHQNMFKYYANMIYMFIVTLINGAMCYLVAIYLNQSIIMYFISAAIIFLLSNFIYYIFYHKMSEYKFVMNLVLSKTKNLLSLIKK